MVIRQGLQCPNVLQGDCQQLKIIFHLLSFKISGSESLNCNFPNWILICISQMLVKLKNKSLSGLATINITCSPIRCGESFSQIKTFVSISSLMTHPAKTNPVKARQNLHSSKFYPDTDQRPAGVLAPLNSLLPQFVVALKTPRNQTLVDAALLTII